MAYQWLNNFLSIRFVFIWRLGLGVGSFLILWPAESEAKGQPPMLSANGSCHLASDEARPEGWDQGLIFLWRKDGALDVLTCIQSASLQSPRILRWATVVFKGVSVETRGEERHLVLGTTDGSIDLGLVSHQPCLRKDKERQTRECAVAWGEKKIRPAQEHYWTMSLILGADGGVASQVRFLPRDQPEEVTYPNQENVPPQ